MKKEAYERAEIVISVFKKEDIVTASVVPDDPFVPDIEQGDDDTEVLPFG